MMRNVSSLFRRVHELVAMRLSLIVDAGCYLGLGLRPSPTLAAENLFLRQQLALYQERQVKPQQATNAIRLAMVCLSRWFDWRSALSIVTPETFTRWHRQGFRLFWRWKSKPGRPALPKDLQALIRRMALENRIWGQERIASHTFILPTLVLVEITYLYTKGRIEIDAAMVQQRLVSASNCVLYPLDEPVAMLIPTELNIHDAIIGATALVHRDILTEPVAVITKNGESTRSGLIDTVW